jgi:hypothetical protein
MTAGGGVRVLIVYGLLGLRYLFYKGVACPLELTGGAPPLVPPPSLSAGPSWSPPPYKCNLSPVNRSIQFCGNPSPLTGTTVRITFSPTLEYLNLIIFSLSSFTSIFGLQFQWFFLYLLQHSHFSSCLVSFLNYLLLFVI